MAKKERYESTDTCTCGYTCLDDLQVAVLIVKRFASLTNTLLTSAQSTEVLGSLGDSVAEKLLWQSMSKTV